MAGKVLLRSADGELFEVCEEAARLSPVIAGILDEGGEDEEVPTPLVRSGPLARLLEHCERKISTGQWDVRRLGSGEAELEALFWAADFLGLERFAGLCLAKVALVLHATANGTSGANTGGEASPRALRRALGRRDMRLPPEHLCEVLKALGLRAERGDADALRAVLSQAHHAAPGVRKAAADAAGRLALRDDAAALSALNPLLRDNDRDVRRTALCALGQIAGQGNAKAAAAARRFAEDGDAGLRQLALALLRRTALPNEGRTLGIIRRHLNDGCAEVRRAALEALATLAEAGESWVMEAASRRLEDVDAGVREAAVAALGELAKGRSEGDEGVAATPVATATAGLVAARLEHCYGWVARAAVQALVALSSAGSRTPVMEAVLQRLGHPDATVRRTALEALHRVAPWGDSTALEGLAQYLEHSDDAVRRGACEGMRALGGGLEQTVMLCARRLEHSDEGVRFFAASVLPLLASGTSSNASGDDLVDRSDLVLSGTLPRLKHQEAATRSAALAALCHLGLRNNARVVRAIVPLMVDPSAKVRQHALDAFSQLADRDNPEAVASLASFLAYRNTAAIACAIKALTCVACRGNQDSIRVVSRYLQHRAGLVRSAAVEALAGLLGGGDTHGRRLLARRLADRDASVRTAALAALRQLEGPNSSSALVSTVSVNLDSRVEKVRLSAVHAVAQLADGDSLGALKALARALCDSSRYVRAAAAKAVLRLPHEIHKHVKDEVSALLGDRSWEVRWCAAGILAELVCSDDAKQKDLSFLLPHLRSKQQRTRDVCSILSVAFRSAGGAKGHRLIKAAIAVAGTAVSMPLAEPAAASQLDLAGKAAAAGTAAESKAVAADCPTEVQSSAPVPACLPKRSGQGSRWRQLNSVCLQVRCGQPPAEAMAAAAAYQAETAARCKRRRKSVQAVFALRTAQKRRRTSTAMGAGETGKATSE